MKQNKELELISYEEDLSNISNKNSNSMNKNDSKSKKNENSSQNNNISSLLIDTSLNKLDAKSTFFQIDENFCCKSVIAQFTKIEECSILKYGIKLSTDPINFGFCYSCDTNLITPICINCLKKCHLKKGHDTREIDYKDHILCGCGEKMHNMLAGSKKKKLKISRECPYTDWCEKGKLSTLYVVESKCVCEFCYRMCGYEGIGYPLEKEREMLKVCECEDINGSKTHVDLKKIYNKLEEIIDKDYLILGIEPVKFFNLVFLGKSTYECIFQKFEEILGNLNRLNPKNKLQIKDNFFSTNFYLSLTLFVKIIKKSKIPQLRYYDSEIANKFSFNLISKIIKYTEFNDKAIYWLFIKNILYVFRKVNVAVKNISMNKFKLNDFENFSPILRKLIEISNFSKYPNVSDQTEFFISYLNTLLNYEIRSEYAFEVINEVCSIIKILSGYYLLSSKNMNHACIVIEKIFDNFRLQKFYKKQLKLFYILIKMFSYFIYCYNDNSFYNYLLENKNDDVTNVKFIFDKNELGRFISRNTLRMMYYVILVKKKYKLTDDEIILCHKILNYGTKILCLMITSKDNYFMNSNYSNIKKKVTFLNSVISIRQHDSVYFQILDEKDTLENIFNSYYIFDLDENDILVEINDSLEKILNLAKSKTILPYLLKSNFYFVICKIIYIIDFNTNNEEIEDDNLKKNILSNIFLFLQFFIGDNSDHALLICSHYILESLLKIPEDYTLELFKIFAKCSDIISNNRGYISNPDYIIIPLFKHLIEFKNNSEDIWSKISQNFFMDDVKILDHVIFLFLNIVIRFYLKMKILYPKSANNTAKKLAFAFLNHFPYGELMCHNACLILILVNKVFDSNEHLEQEQILKLIPVQNVISTLEDTNIEIGFRTEILIFIKKFKCSLFFRHKNLRKSSLNYSFLDILNEYPQQQNEDEIKKVKSEKKKAKGRSKIKQNSVRRKSLRETGEINANYLFSFDNEEIEKHFDYINAIGQDGDNFAFIKNNPLISNYKYPSKSLSFQYYFVKNDYYSHNIKVIEAGLILYEKELQKFKDIFEKNINLPNKIFKYYVKGIIFPVCALVKLSFCYLGKASGSNILNLYQIIMKMMYIKNFVMDLSTSFIHVKINAQFENFDLTGFLEKNLYEESLEDYFTLKGRNKFSPYDFTHLWEIFEKHFLNYIIYPKSLNLQENFPLTTIDFLLHGNLSEESDIFEEGIYINLKKRGTNALIQKAIHDKTIRQNLVVGDSTNKSSDLEIENGRHERKSVFFSRKTFFLESMLSNSSNIFQETDNKTKATELKIKKIFEYYCQEKNNINKGDSSLFVSLPELCGEYEINFRKILLCILRNIPEEGEEYLSVSINIIYILLTTTTIDTQEDIISLMGGKDVNDLDVLVNISNAFYKNIIKYFIDDFNYNFIRYKDNQIKLFSLCKILKLLCVEHNNFFQEKLISSLEYTFTKLSECKMMSTRNSKNKISSKVLDEIDCEDTMSFFNFLLNVIHKILIVTNNAHSKDHISFFYDIFYSIINLLIEIIQENKIKILSRKAINDDRNNMSRFTCKNFISIVSDILLDDSLITGDAFRIRLLLISFFMTIMEEKNNEEIQKIIMKFLTIKKVMESIIFTMKNYFYEQTKDNPKYKQYYSNFSDKEIVKRKFIFDYTVFSFFKEHYFHSSFSKESKEFELANNYYKYIKKLSVSEKSNDANDLISQIDKLSEEDAKKKFSLFNKKTNTQNKVTPINLNNEKEKRISISYIENYYIVKFFEIITKVVEIRLPHENRNVNVIFTMPCEMIHLSKMTKDEFEYNVDRSSENSKKFELIRSIPLFQLEIEYFKNKKVSWISKLILNVDYIYVQFIVYGYATIFLILMLFTLEGYTGIKPDEEVEEDRRLRNLKVLRILYKIPSYITDSIDVSIEKWGDIYDYICYLFCFLNGLLIVSWIAVKMPFYYILDKFKYIEERKMKMEDLTILNKARIMVIDTIVGRDYITTLLYLFLISLIGAIMERGEITYAFLLLAIIDLNQTLKGIAISIKIRAPDLISSFFLLILLIYFYSNLGFFYLNDNFAADIEDDVPDNYCLCLSFCFMTNFDAGIRARGGAADQMVRVSYGRNKVRYIVRVIYDVTYFLINIIIMIDLVFGIILGTFSEMREEERKHDDDKANHCFLCHVTREIVEKLREDYKYHKNKKHYLWNYVDYMIFLKFSKIHDLNAVNSFARENLDAKNICFLPSYQDKFDLDEEKEESEEYEEEEEEEEEESEESSDMEDEENEEEDEKSNENDNKLVSSIST